MLTRAAVVIPKEDFFLLVLILSLSRSAAEQREVDSCDMTKYPFLPVWYYCQPTMVERKKRRERFETSNGICVYFIDTRCERNDQLGHGFSQGLAVNEMKT